MNMNKVVTKFLRCTDIWTTRRVGDSRLGDNVFRDEHLGDTGRTFGGKQLEVSSINVETFGLQK